MTLAPGGATGRIPAGLSAPGPTGVSVTGTPASATVVWQPVSGVASYSVTRMDPAAAPVQASLPPTATSWLDTGLLPASPYTYVVNAVYPSGQIGSTSVPFTTPPAINPSGFTAAETGAGQVQLGWQPVRGVSYYVLLGPGVPGGGTKVGLATSYTATGVPSGPQTWAVASYYDPTGVPGSAVSTPGSQFTNVSLTVSAPVTSGHYLVTVTGLRVFQASSDDILSRDGMGDEVFAAAYVRRYDRGTGQIAEFSSRQTMVYGDVNGFGTQRVQAGTMSPTGGLRNFDVIPDGATSTERLAPPQDVVFPWRLWEGTLTDKSDALVISPSIWEVDGDNSPFQYWVQQQTTRNASIFVSTSVQNQISTLQFGHLIQGGAEAPGGIFAIDPKNVATDAVLGFMGLPPLATLLAGSADRPIGVVQSVMNAFLPNTTVVLTREIIEQALAQRPIGATMINGFPLALTQPGIMVIPFVDGRLTSLLKASPAVYLMLLQVERLP